MQGFLLIDHSLEDAGGHHLMYAEQVLQAGEATGYAVQLACHRRFDVRGLSSTHIPVWPVFNQNAYCLEALLCPPGGSDAAVEQKKAGGNLAGIPHWSWWKRWRAQRRRRRRQRHISSQFQSGLQQMARYAGWSADDHIFVATSSELDLSGLADFLATAPVPKATWHVQFHFGFDNTPNSRMEIQTRLQTAARRLVGQRVYLYTTTNELADYFNDLGLARFHSLPYPLHQEFLKPLALPETHNDGALRILCAGGTRPEKGLHQLPEVAAALKDLLAENRIRFLVQTDPNTAPHWQGLAAQLPPGGLELVPHPLSEAEYIQLVKTSHIGLMMYDPDCYRHRRAGVLCEFLSAGIPVVVPDNCWLAGQVGKQVGRAASHPAQFAQQLRYLSDNYRRFSTAARSHAPGYRELHRAERTVEQLIQTSARNEPSFQAIRQSSARAG